MTVARAFYWPHHGGMSIPHARAGERGLPERDRSQSGASILAGLVLMAMLGAAVVGVGSSNLFVQSQLAQSAAPTTLDDNGLKQGVQVKCGSETVTVNYACVQRAKAEDFKKLQQKCTPGFSYKITEDKKTAIVTVAPTPIDQNPCAKIAAPQPCKIGGNALQAVVGAASQCPISYCPPDSACRPVGVVENGKDLGLAEKRAAAVLDLYKNSTPAEGQKLLGAINGDDTLKAAFEQEKADADAKAKEAEAAAARSKVAREDARRSLDLCIKGGGDCSDQNVDVRKTEADAKAAAEKAAAAQAEYKKLADAKVTLTPPETTVPETPAEKVLRERREAEQRSAAEAAQRAAAQQQQTGFGGGGGLDGLLKSLMGGNQQKGGAGGAPSPLNGGPCTPGYQCKNNTLYYQNQSQDSTHYYCNAQPVQQCQYGCSSATTCAQAPNQGQNCPAAPVQPDPSGCSAGTWKPTYTGACVNGWQCTSGSGTGQFAAQISCQPQIADVGMSLAISYSCFSGTSEGSGFQTNGAQSGSATVTVANPPANTNTATYGLKCTNQGQTATAQCTVQVGRPFIVLVANPRAVASSTASRLGWVTSGMQSCVISSPDLPAFTAQNAGNTSVSGTATTPPLNSAARFFLNCTTVGGGTRQASTTVSIIGVPDTFTDNPSGSVTVRSTADATTIGHGATTTITWRTQNATAGSAMSLWVFDVRLNQSTGLIAGAKSASGTYTWTLPGVDEACPVDSPRVCATDLVAGRKYIIEAALYTPSDAFLGGFPPANPINPTYIDYGFGEEFTMGD